MICCCFWYDLSLNRRTLTDNVPAGRILSLISNHTLFYKSLSVLVIICNEECAYVYKLSLKATFVILTKRWKNRLETESIHKSQVFALQ